MYIGSLGRKTAKDYHSEEGNLFTFGNGPYMYHTQVTAILIIVQCLHFFAFWLCIYALLLLWCCVSLENERLNRRPDYEIMLY